MNRRRDNLLAQLYAHRFSLGLIGIALLAVYFRTWQLGSLPPGLHQTEATSGLAAIGVSAKLHSLVALKEHGLGAALLILIQAVSIKLFGNTAYALRIVSVLIGLLAVAGVYLWAKAWFNRRVAIVAALLMAVTPWTVGFSRLGIAAGATCAIIPLTLWFATKAAQTKRWPWVILTAVSLAVCAGSLGGLFFLGILAVILMPVVAKLRRTDPKLAQLALITVGVATILSLPAISLRLQHTRLHLPRISGESVQQTIAQASTTFAMFNLHGDQDYRYNIAGVPQLNLFVGLMFLVGILVCALRISQTRYRNTLLILTAGLAPAILQVSAAPVSLSALIVAPVALTLAAIGIMYMLEVWYSTFPINSAARTLGTIPIVLLLVISIYQGYKQYFVAWARSPEVYEVYNERSRSLADYMNRTNFNGTRYVMANGYDLDVIQFLTNRHAAFTVISLGDVPNIPKTGQAKQILFITPQDTDIIKVLKQQFPKAKLSQHYSEFNDNTEIFAIYEVSG